MDDGVPEEILLDENEEGRRYVSYDVCGLKISPNEQLLAYFQDTKGNGFYSLKIKHIYCGKQFLKNQIRTAGNQCEWGSNSATLFYLTLDAVGRPNKVWKHVLNTSPDEDTCLYTEADPAFYVSLYKTRDKSTICIQSSTHPIVVPVFAAFRCLCSFQDNDGVQDFECRLSR